MAEPVSERRWIVWLRPRPKQAFGPCDPPHPTLEDAADHADMLHGLWPEGAVEIEERETISRTVERRRIPRPARDGATEVGG